jgi:mono/diheme cytochrome c family protein
LLGAFSLARAAAADLPNRTATVIQDYCMDCHDAATKKGGLSLEGLNARNPAANPEAWERVLLKLRHRQMPPIGETRPDEASYEAVVTHLQSSIDRAAAAQPNPGHVDTFRRLTRTEYHNAIRDLLDLEIDASALLPKDDSSHGFDNITVGELSPSLLERYLGAAKKIGQIALGRPLSAPQGETMQVPIDLTQEGEFADLPPGTRGGASTRFNFPRDGEYEVQLRLARDRNDKVEGLLRGTSDIDLLVDGAPVTRFQVAAPGRGATYQNVDLHLSIRVPVKAGPHEVSATFPRTSTVLGESEREPTLAHFNMDRHPRLQPAIYSISVVGPYNATGPGDTPSRRRIFPSFPTGPAQEDATAQKVIATLARRAFRRPVTAQDLAGPLRFYTETKAKEGFEAGIEMALRAILVSPNFLFRIEPDPPGTAAGKVFRVPDLQLASRLSFFLWSSIPDDELLDVASQGTLSRPEVLAAQTRRMLQDPRSSALVESFASQWLYLRNVDLARPDARLFMDFDENLRSAMRRETELFCTSILREDRSVLDLLRARFTFLNERLAKHYGIAHVYGSEFRRVELGPEDRAGGLLNHGSILTVTSHANRTSPVVRGNWILTNLLGTPPKPPPPDVPQLKEKNEAGKNLSMREQMARHRSQPACATCHNLMDPIGFALENYDAVGRWRTSEGGQPLDTTGSLPDGTAFHSPAELQQAILKRPELFVHTLAEKLLVYSLGRGLEYYDEPAVRQIVHDAAPEDYRLSAIVLGLVRSAPFQMKEAK